MFRPLQYFILFLIVVLSQIFIFDGMKLSTFIVPLIYITYIILLPIQTGQLTMMMWGVLLGVTMDLATGMPGINSITTILISFIRINIISFIIGKDMLIKGIPTANTLGFRRFGYYLSLMVILHVTIQLTIEFANFSELEFLFRRILYSSIFSIIFAWLIAGRFQQVISRKF